MDSITQAVLGATLQAALLGRWQGRKALLYGAALATLPDLDVVIDYGDAVAGMTYHRSFSHSLLSSLYLGFTVAGKQMAEQAVEKELTRQGIHADALFSGPTPFNSLLWRVIVRDGADYHEAVVGWFDRQPPRIERFARGTGLRAVLADSPQEKRLEWFTGDWLRYDEIDGRLIVTDLRLGMTGFHPFRFPLAERRSGQWQLIPYVERLPMERGGAAQMKQVWSRIWQQQPPLPLREWADSLKQTSRPVGA